MRKKHQKVIKPKELFYNPQKLKELRLKKRMSQLALAIESGLSLITVSKVELGLTHPKISTLIKIANVLGVSINKLCEKEVK